MVFFKKNSILLKDLIPNDYVDIHSHLLPTIDDGAKSIEDTLFLLKKLKDIGFNEFITTPHVMGYVWNNSKKTVLDNYNSTSDLIKKTEINLPFNVAAEYMMDDNFSHLLKTEKLLTLKDNYLLVEMSYLNPPLNLFDILFDIQIAGYKPVLAHPERYNFYHSNYNEFHKLKKAGCLFQLNLLSSIGYYGGEAVKAADYLLKNKLIDFVGSDVHHNNHVEGFNKKIVLKNVDFLKPIFQNNLIFKQ